MYRINLNQNVDYINNYMNVTDFEFYKRKKRILNIYLVTTFVTTSFSYSHYFLLYLSITEKKMLNITIKLIPIFSRALLIFTPINYKIPTSIIY